ncbi:MAG: helix-turn-helix domain-containing protein [Clostridia bacterium]|nr:helix-turn-helix domain-containing protein [Clostridia bacterium]
MNTFNCVYYDELQTISHRLGKNTHSHINCELTMFLEGEATNTVNGTSRRVKRGDVVFLNTVSTHSITDHGEMYAHRDVYIHPNTLKEVCSLVFDDRYYEYLTNTKEEIVIPLTMEQFLFFANHLADLEIKCRLASSEKMKNVIKKSVLCALMNILSIHYESLQQPSKQHQLQNITEFLKWVQDCHVFSRPVNEIIALSDFSHTHFLRLFKQISDKTFKEYLTELRIEHSKTLLVNDHSLSVLDISLDVGFNNLSHFIQCFKKQVGLTPLQYRYSVLRPNHKKKTKKSVKSPK